MGGIPPRGSVLTRNPGHTMSSGYPRTSNGAVPRLPEAVFFEPVMRKGISSMLRLYLIFCGTRALDMEVIFVSIGIDSR